MPKQYTCESCFIVFFRPPSYDRNSKRVYCSHACTGVGKSIIGSDGLTLKAAGVYAIVHNPTGQTYIGSSRNMAKRRGDHYYALNRSTHRRKNLQDAWIRYGGGQFSFIVLERVASQSLLVQCEQFWIDHYIAMGIPLFNRSLHADTTKGLKKSPEERTRMSESRIFGGKLSHQDILDIRRVATDRTTYTTLAIKYGVHRHTIYMIATKRMWPDIA